MNTLHDNKPQAGPRSSLLAAGVAAILASACCLGPLVLVLLGFSGAWIGNLAILEPWRPAFTGLALVSLALAAWQLWRPAGTCTPGRVCAQTGVRRAYKALFWTVAVLVLLALGFPYVAPWFY